MADALAPRTTCTRSSNAVATPAAHRSSAASSTIAWLMASRAWRQTSWRIPVSPSSRSPSPRRATATATGPAPRRSTSSPEDSSADARQVTLPSRSSAATTSPATVTPPVVRRSAPADGGSAWLAEWIDDHCTFPNSMVDRITPVTSDADRGMAPRRRWASRIDGRWSPSRFGNGSSRTTSPTGGRVGTTSVPSSPTASTTGSSTSCACSTPATHAWRTSAHSPGSPTSTRRCPPSRCDDSSSGLLHLEAVPSLQEISGHPAIDYVASVLDRFANTGVRDQIARLCIDGSAKFPTFLLPTVGFQLEHDGPIARSALALAGWAQYLAVYPAGEQAFDAAGDVGAPVRPTGHRRPRAVPRVLRRVPVGGRRQRTLPRQPSPTHGSASATSDPSPRWASDVRSPGNGASPMTTTDSSSSGTSAVGGAKLQHHRQREIYMLALRSGAVDVADLARRFDVTTETIRRDLSDLQQRQLLERVHGGAVPFERHHHEPMLDARDMLNAEEKLRIGREAIHQVPEHGSVIVDSGSTGQRFAEVFPVDRPRARRHELAAHCRHSGQARRERVDGARRWRAHEHVRNGRRVHGRRCPGTARRRAVHQLRRAVVPTWADDALSRRERR